MEWWSGMPDTPYVPGELLREIVGEPADEYGERDLEKDDLGDERMPFDLSRFEVKEYGERSVQDLRDLLAVKALAQIGIDLSRENFLRALRGMWSTEAPEDLQDLARSVSFEYDDDVESKLLGAVAQMALKYNVDPPWHSKNASRRIGRGRNSRRKRDARKKLALRGVEVWEVAETIDV